LRSIDLASGAVEVIAALEWARGAGATAKIEPAPQRDAAAELAIPYVDTASVADPYALAGDAVSLEVAGRFPTPGFELAGFDIAADAAAPTRLPVSRRATPPPGTAAQVLSPFRATAKISALRIGTYTLEVRGRDASKPSAPVFVDVVPPNLLVQWEASPR